MTTRLPNLCDSCKHFKRTKGTCVAFPGGIPKDIMLFGGDHREVLPNQKGTTVHELADGKEEAFEDWMFTYVLPAD